MRSAIFAAILATAARTEAQTTLRIVERSSLPAFPGATIHDLNEIRSHVTESGGVLLMISKLQTVYHVSANGTLTDSPMSWSMLAPTMRNAQQVLGRSADTIRIVDSRTRSQVVFARAATGKWGKVADQSVPLDAVVGACEIRGGELAVLTSQPAGDPPGIVHRVTASGNRLTSFGEIFGDSHGPASLAYGFGHVTCSRTRNFVFVASRLHPEVRAYRVDGLLEWRIPLRPFPSIRVIEEREGRFRYQYAADSVWYETSGLFEFGGLLLVQARQRLGKAGSDVGTTTWVVDAERGATLETSETYPRFLAVSKTQAIAAPSSPDGKLKTFRIGLKP